MRGWKKWVAVTVIVGAVSFALTPAIWPQPANINPGGYLPFFVFLSVLESLAFGLGVAFLAFGYPLIAGRGNSQPLSIAAYLATGWFLVNWWPHDNLHKVVQFNIAPLLAIEYGFHVTLMVAGAILALFFFRTLSEPRTIAAVEHEPHTAQEPASI